MKLTNPLIFTTFSLILLLIIHPTFGATKSGGYQPIKDINDQSIKLIAEFAVYEHNQQAKTKLVLNEIKQGYYQIVAGTNYKLIISAKDKHDHKSINDYETVVFEGLPTQNPVLQLVSFDRLLKTKH
ncbi:unnamed protein product [Amaranthus hypochondriacus]